VLRLLILLAFVTQTVAAEENRTTTHPTQQIQAIAQTLRGRLSMQQNIQVSVAAHNERMVSVERLSADAFIMSFDQQFLNALTDQELIASIAHELGHVWIFTHHPYLQTEALANEIAMRVVSRDSLAGIYQKLWTHLGSSGDLNEFLGQPAFYFSEAGSDSFLGEAFCKTPTTRCPPPLPDVTISRAVIFCP
jgi:hypothetical protein